MIKYHRFCVSYSWDMKSFTYDILYVLMCSPDFMKGSGR